jgi:hypothetical protein
VPSQILIRRRVPPSPQTHLGGVHVRHVLIRGLVATVVVLNDGIEDGRKDSVRLFVAGVKPDACGRAWDGMVVRRVSTAPLFCK